MNQIPLHKQLSAAYRKQTLPSQKILAFEQEINTLLNQLEQHLQTKGSREENVKLHILNFLEKSFYPKDKHLIQPLGDIDLALFLSAEISSPIGVLLEIKQPDNKHEFPQAQKLNNKALQQLLYYYLQQRVTLKNNNLKYLILSNGFEWYVFSAEEFRNIFYEDKSLLKEFDAFEKGQKDSKKTKLFYEEIAQPSIAKHLDQLPYSYFDLRNPTSFQSIETLYKFFSPPQLLAQVQHQDQNQLNKDFYFELLHILGLEEVNEQGRKLIQRCAPERREVGSLLEMSLDLLIEQDFAKRWPQNLDQNAIFDLALELCLTWINRILFLKLLESQLLNYQPEQKAYRFLNTQVIPDFNRLDELFFGVLAKEPQERSPRNQQRFGPLPYLNSSLFEPSNYEASVLRISNLPQETLKLYPQTVLKDHQFQRLKQSLPSLEYLFRFLDAYDFGSENQTSPDRPKTLISASVLGLIFEKINGYQDGSFYTPAYVTMYMSQQSIRRAVLKHFNQYYSWQLQNFDDLKRELRQELRENPQQRSLIAAYFNQIKICDPAVGSGHFLVSALNELLLLKQELGLILDQNNKVLPLEFSIEQDELIIEYQDTGLAYQYQPQYSKTAAYQETLFRQKQSLIENCLFGLDINPNSVKICRLRLWIELLKHAYHKPDGQLQTLPNIDINIKIGNSLLSRYDLNQNLSHILNRKGFSQQDYQTAVQTYRQALNKTQKQQMSQMIQELKTHIVQSLRAESKDYRQLEKKKREYFYTYEAETLIQTNDDPQQKAQEQNLALQKIQELETKIAQQENPSLFQHAFEWRFEFPDVLNAQGDFLGFDVLIGNPPYIRQEQIPQEHKAHFKQHYQTYQGKADLYVYFVEKAFQLLKPQGEFSYILPNKWLQAGYAQNLRDFIRSQHIHEILDFDDLPVFAEASTYPMILSMAKQTPSQNYFLAQKVPNLNFQNFNQHVQHNFHQVQYQSLSNQQSWNLGKQNLQNLIQKIQAQHPKLIDFVQGNLYRGVTTGCNQAFIIDTPSYQQLIQADPKNAQILKPVLAGRDVKRYAPLSTDKYLIYTHKGIDIDAYPHIKNHLAQFKSQLDKKAGGNAWYELQGSPADAQRFEKPKIVFPDISIQFQATFDFDNYYYQNTSYVITDVSKSLIGILNSKLMRFFYSKISPSIRGGYFRFIKQYVSELPIPLLSEQMELALEVKVKEVLSAKARGEDTSLLEGELDALVYEVYGLDAGDIALLEASLGD